MDNKTSKTQDKKFLRLDMPREMVHHVAEHEVMMSFWDDEGAVAFNEWWDFYGSALFKKYFDSKEW